MFAKNLYAVLGVDEKSGPEDLRRAWLRLAVKYHPDRNPGDARAEENFKEISQAYALLSDPAARARYERTRPRTTARPKARPRPRPKPEPPKAAPPKPEPPGTEPPEPDWDEILAQFFQTPKGQDTLRDLEGELGRTGLKFTPGDFTRWFQARRPPTARPDVPATGTRPWLLGRLKAWLPGGEVWTNRRNTRYDIHYELALSPEAAVHGTVVEIAYLRDDQTRQLKIRIPAGTKDGARLRLAGQGQARPDQGRGDLVLTVQVGRRPSVADLWSD